MQFINVSFTEDIIDEKLCKNMNSAYYVQKVDKKMLYLIELLAEKQTSDKEIQHLINALLYNVIRDEYKLNKTDKTILNKNIHNAIRYISENFQKPADVPLKNT